MQHLAFALIAGHTNCSTAGAYTAGFSAALVPAPPTLRLENRVSDCGLCYRQLAYEIIIEKFFGDGSLTTELVEEWGQEGSELRPQLVAPVKGDELRVALAQ